MGTSIQHGSASCGVGVLGHRGQQDGGHAPAARCPRVAHPPGHRAPCAHQHEQEQAPVIRRQHEGWHAAVGHLVGHGSAVSRIPRICGGGTHRSGQGAFGNQCRGGRMFNPTKQWRKWTAKTNNNERRVAVCSALAASSVPALLMARGHKVSTVAEVPLVVANEIEATSKTKDALALLKTVKAMEDVDHVKDSRKIRRCTGKMRNRRYVERKGPLLVYANNNGIEQGFRNIPGVEIACVDRLNLLKLAPGGHLGRFVIWTQAAFEKLDSTFGTYTAASDVKKTFALPRTMMSNADLARIINSDEIQTKVRAARE